MALEALRRLSCIRRTLLHLVLCLAGLVTIGCTRSPSRSDVDLTWPVVRNWTIDGSSPSLSLSDVERFQITADGDRIYLLARPEHRVFVLNSDGVMTDTIGREGQGPGEFVDPWAITVSENHEVSVVDPGARRVIRWNATRQLLDPLPIQDPLDHPRMAIHAGEMWFTVAEPAGDGHSEYRLIARGAGGRKVIAALMKPPRKVADFPTCRGRGISVQPLFAPVIQWDLQGTKAVVNHGPDYRIEVFEQDSQVDTLVRAIPPEMATEALAEAEAADWRLNDCVVPPREVVRATGFEPRIPVVQAIALAPGGEVWVLRRANRSHASRIDLFSSAGAYLGTLPEGFPFPAAFLSNDRFVALTKDSLDVPSVSLYTFRRSSPAQ